MRVPEILAQSTIFLCVRQDEKTEEVSYRGTAFFVAVRAEDPADNHSWGYLVTARHNVENAQRRITDGGSLYARINFEDGRSEIQMLPPDAWIYPDDDAVDLAITRVPELAGSTLCPVPDKLFATRSVIDELHIGIGDEVIVTGLFAVHPGRVRNIPLVRSGIIAAMPEETLQDQRSGLEYQAYMVELRSFGGLSGSPVFAALHTGSIRSIRGGFKYYLLGLVRGHWDAYGPAREIDGESEMINLGIAIVTPADELHKLLFCDDETKFRRQRDRNYRERRAGLTKAT